MIIRTVCVYPSDTSPLMCRLFNSYIDASVANESMCYGTLKTVVDLDWYFYEVAYACAETTNQLDYKDVCHYAEMTLEDIPKVIGEASTAYKHFLMWRLQEGL